MITDEKICCVDTVNVKFVGVVRVLLAKILYNSALCGVFNGSLLANVEIILLICYYPMLLMTTITTI